MDYPNRKNTRLNQYDYATPGYYFVTVCTHQRQKLFDSYVGAHLCVRPSPVPQFPIIHWIYELERKYPGIVIDSFCVMPDHIHIIIAITGAHTGAPLHDIIKWYKTQTTNAYIKGVRSGAFQSFHQRIWQRGYYEHIIRNDTELHETRQYIQNNPLNWILDKD